MGRGSAAPRIDQNTYGRHGEDGDDECSDRGHQVRVLLAGAQHLAEARAEVGRRRAAACIQSAAKLTLIGGHVSTSSFMPGRKAASARWTLCLAAPSSTRGRGRLL